MTERDPLLAQVEALLRQRPDSDELKRRLWELLNPPQGEIDLERPLEELIHPTTAESKYTPDRVAAILEMIRMGAALKLAADAASISAVTLQQWLSDDRKPEFRALVQKARAQHAQYCLLQINAAATKNWTAAAWQLERLYPELYGQREVIEHQGPGGGPVTVTSPAVQEAEHLLRAFRQRLLPAPAATDVIDGEVVRQREPWEL